MRAELIRFVMAQCHTLPPLWSIEQAIDLLQYFDSCWALPEGIRGSWIDERRLQLLTKSGVVLTNGGIENSHRWLDDHFFRLQLNRDVLTVLTKVAGMDARGVESAGVFDADMKRLVDVRGTTPKLSVDVGLSMARAALRLLQLVAEGDLGPQVVLWDASTAYVHRFGAERLLRHAEPSALQVCSFPAALQPMKQVLAHAGAHSFERMAEGYHTVDRRTGRCDCDASHYNGVVGAKGPCKHARLCRSVEELRASPSGRERVLQAARQELYRLVHTRESRKPLPARCVPLYNAADADAIVELLKTFVSVPPTGKSTGLDDIGSAAGSSGGVDDSEPCQPPELRCSFAATPNAGEPFLDLGLVFVRRELGEGEPMHGLELRVAACSQLASGIIGPAAHTGDTIRPGDILFAINGDAAATLPYLDSDQILCLPASKMATLHFYRLPPALAMAAAAEEDGPLEEGGSSQGGRPAGRQAKFPASGGRQPSKRGGVPARRGHKPQGLPARLQKQINVPAGSLKRRAALASAELLGEGYMEGEIARLRALDQTDTYVP